MTPTKEGIDQAIAEAMSTATDVVRTRIDKLGTREPSIVKQGTNRIVVQVPGLKDPTQLKKLIGTTAKLEFKMVDDRPYGPGVVIPPDEQVLPYPEGGPKATIVVKRHAIITGDQLLSATQGYKPDEPTRPIVNFAFDSAGGRKFADITQTSVGKRFAVVVDNQVISAPVINGAILGDRAISRVISPSNRPTTLRSRSVRASCPSRSRSSRNGRSGPTSAGIRSMPASRHRPSR